MPRQARIDFEGALHHVIIRGINRANIFLDDRDRNQFLIRLELGLEETGLDCYAWALIPNHAHFLFQTGHIPLSALMRRLLTGYALYFNLRHKRTGHLFQNRYKSILCQKESYFLQLVRYIHLNPLRAGLIPDISGLNAFKWCGHGVLLGLNRFSWQNTDEVLARFASRTLPSRRRYLNFIIKGIPEGRRPDLVGGGLIRSAGGWHNLLELRRMGERCCGDERILGDSDFIERVLAKTKDRFTKKETNLRKGWNLNKLEKYVTEKSGLGINALKSKKRTSEISNARALFTWWAANRLGFNLTEIATFLEISVPAAFKAVRRGEEISRQSKFESLFDHNERIS